MVHVASRLQADTPQPAPDSSVLALQADCRGATDVEETLPMLPAQPQPVVLRQRLPKVACGGRLHAPQTSFSFS